LAKVDLQRVVLPQKRLGTELEGPLQYVIVSVSNDSELQRWLGRVLPERRFELLTARGPAEGESLCREHQPDLLLLDWEHDTDFAQQSLARIRDNPLTHYVRVAFVTPEESLAAHFAAIRLGAMGVIPRTAKPKDVFARVMLCVLAPGELPAEELGETTMSEFSALLLRELRVELEAIQGVVGDVSVPVGGELGRVLRDTSRRLRDEVKGVLGGGASARAEGGGVVDEQVRAELFQGKRALVMEADRLRRAELTRAVGELGLELLTPMPDLTKALEAGLAWAPDVLVGGAPEQDSVVCARILRHDIALSSMSVVVVRWPDTGRQWPDARADMELLRPWLEQRLVDAFAPAAEVKRQLQGQQAVTGRVESCGMFALLQLALTHRQQACLNIREGTDQFQAFLYQGTIHDVIWREGDGTETRQFDAFARMLAVSRGGFMVDECKEMPDPSLPGTFGDLLTAACHWWRPLSLVVDQRLLDVQPLTLDRRRTAEFRRQSGQVHRRVVKALRSGVSPAQIIDEGVEAGVVADVLRELVRRFAVRQLPVGA
jgi:ActR/RegA family two-component response regulator